MNIASVILDIKTQALGGAYSYAIPAHLTDVSVGCVVRVPFGRRQACGFVISVNEDADPASLGIDPSKVREIYEVLAGPFFGEDAAACIMWMADHYVAPLSDCVKLFTPPGGVPSMKKVGHAWVVERPAVGEVDDRWVRLGPAAADYKPRANAVKQQAILDALKSGELRVAELATEFGNVNSSLNSLAGKDVVVIERKRRMRGVPAADGECGVVSFERLAPVELTQGQANALEHIQKACAAANGSVVVVDGVTGSGKTEVYLQALEQVVSQGRSGIVLVPEISLTPQTVARFRGRFGDMVAVLHSRMSTGERYDQWDLIAQGSARVVVGARSALFAPMRDVGLIIIDEEHESTYKQENAPRYVSRDVAAYMARRMGATLVLGSATPSVEALYRSEHDPLWSIVSLPERANGRPLPAIEVVDMTREFADGSRSMFSKRLSRALHEVLSLGQKAVLLLNQRGFAKFLLCRECGFVPECPDCSLSYTYHEQGNMLVCHHCGASVPAPSTCPACGSPYLKRLGAGTQRVEVDLVNLIEAFGDVDARVIRMDADTTKNKGDHQRLLEQFACEGPAVLLGTQMIAKGLDFDDVTLVGVVHADTQLRLPDFRAGERTFDLIEQVAGRAGRADLPGRVIVQTHDPGSVAIRAAATYDRHLFLSDELPKRRLLKYPPFARLADVRLWGPDRQEVEDEADSLYRSIMSLLQHQSVADWVVLPPTPCIFERLRGDWHFHITVKAPVDAAVGETLAPLFRSRTCAHDVNVAVDVDPYSLL